MNPLSKAVMLRNHDFFFGQNSDDAGNFCSSGVLTLTKIGLSANTDGLCNEYCLSANTDRLCNVHEHCIARQFWLIGPFWLVLYNQLNLVGFLRKHLVQVFSVFSSKFTGTD